MNTHPIQKPATATKRGYPRYRRRLSLRFSTDAQHWHASFTYNVSPRGMFVAWTRSVTPNTPISLEVQLPGVVGTVACAAIISWSYHAPIQLDTLGHGGFGVELINAPEEWFAYCAELETRCATTTTAMAG